MKDFLGNELNIGDIVICNDKKYSKLIIAKIIKLTPSGVKAMYQSDYNYMIISFFIPSQIIKVMQNEDSITNLIIKSQIFNLNNEYLFQINN